jgi:hypothetical protein
VVRSPLARFSRTSDSGSPDFEYSAANRVVGAKSRAGVAPPVLSGSLSQAPVASSAEQQGVVVFVGAVGKARLAVVLDEEAEVAHRQFGDSLRTALRESMSYSMLRSTFPQAAR